MSFFDHNFDEGARAIAVLVRMILAKLWHMVIVVTDILVDR